MSACKYDVAKDQRAQDLDRMGHDLGTDSFIEAIKEEITAAEQLAPKPFSDLLSTDKSHTLQWVDLVLEGCSTLLLQQDMAVP